MCHFAFILERQRPACWNVQHLGDAWMQTLPSDELNLNRLRKGYTTRTIRDIDKTASLKPLHSINRGFFCTSKVLRNKRSARDACAQTSHTHVTSNVTPKASKIDSREQWQNVSTTMSTIRLTTMRAFFSSIMWGGKWQPLESAQCAGINELTHHSFCNTVNATNSRCASSRAFLPLTHLSISVSQSHNTNRLNSRCPFCQLTKFVYPRHSIPAHFQGYKWHTRE